MIYNDSKLNNYESRSASFAQYFGNSHSSSSNGNYGLSESKTTMNFSCAESNENYLYDEKIEAEIYNGIRYDSRFVDLRHIICVYFQ